MDAAEPRPFRFGVQALPKGRAAWQDLARRVEDLGYATLQTADHIGAPDPFLPLVSAADVTTTLRVGPLVMNNELHEPVLLARQAATTDLLTGGRLELGLGTGYAEDEHRSAGIPIAAPGERVTRFEASVQLLTALLAGQPASCDGPYHVDLADLGVACVQQPHPPLLIGGHGRRGLAIAARHAQIVQLTGLTHGEGGAVQAGGFRVSDIAERVQWVRQQAGERMAGIELSSLVQRVHVGDPGELVHELASHTQLPVDDVLTSPFLLLGTVDALVDKLLEQRERLGISYVTVRDAEAFAPVVARLVGS